jgi:outer membrane receptor protein involved in Fe transport
LVRQIASHAEVFLESRDGVLVTPLLLEASTLVVKVRRLPGLDEQLALEAGYVHQILKHAQLAATYFHNKIDHIIQPPQYGLSYRNLGSSTTQGLELEIRTREIHGLSFLGSYTHLFVAEGAAMRLMVPTHFGAVAMGYSWQRLSVNASAILRSASNVGGNISTAVSEASFVSYHQPARTLLNCHLQVRVWSSLRVFGFADNLLDQRFANDTGVAPPTGLLNRGRTLILGVRGDL